MRRSRWLPSRLRRLLAPFAAVLIMVTSLTAVAPPARADIVAFGTSVLSGYGRVTYQWTAPAPADNVYVIFQSATTGKEWVFQTSSDVATKNGTILFPIRSPAVSTCTSFCFTALVSGVGNYLPNDVYITQMVFLNTLGTYSRSTVNSLTTSSFTKTPSVSNPQGQSGMGANSVSVDVEYPIAPTRGSPVVKFVGKGACSSSTASARISGAAPAQNTGVRFTIQYDPFTATAVSRPTYAATGSPTPVPVVPSSPTWSTTASPTSTPTPSYSTPSWNPSTASPTSTTSYGMLNTSTDGKLLRGCSYDIRVEYYNFQMSPGMPDGGIYTTQWDQYYPTPSQTAVPTPSISPTATPTIWTQAPTPSQTGACATASVMFTTTPEPSCSGYAPPGHAAVQTVTIPDVPGAPTGLTTSFDDGTIPVYFTAPSANNAAITGYQYTLDDGTKWEDFATPGSDEPYMVTGLTNGTEYTIKVRAVNGVGPGPASDAVTGTPVTTPSAPNEVQATPGDGKATVSWTGPTNDGGAAISNYKYSIDDGKTLVTLDPASTTSPITITGLTNGTSYDVKLLAMNIAGDGIAGDTVTVTPRTTPDAPTNLTATPGDGQAEIAFTAGGTGGAAISNYEYKVDDGSWAALAPADDTSPVTVPGLNNGTKYDIRLRAVNDAGGGAASDPVSITPRTTPAAPMNLNVTPGDGQAEIAFTAGDTGGAAISNYEYKVDDGSWTAFNPATTTSPVTVTGLTNGTKYDIRLRAVNDAGSGAASEPVVVTPRTTPDAPTNLQATPGKGKAEITFNVGDDGGSPISNYEYKVDDGNWTPLDPVDDTSPVTVPGLTNGTSYDIRLRAVNDAGSGTASDPVAVTPRAVPDAPTNLSATPGDGQAEVAFTAGDNGGSAISNYEYKVDDGNWTALSPTDDTSPITVGGLTNGTKYDIRLRAVNDAGSGTASDPVAVTPRTTPDAPTGLNAKPGDGRAEIVFSAGGDGGAAVSNYEYQLGDGPWTPFDPAVTSSPVVVTGLTNGTTYDVRLRAVNAAGGGTASDSVALTPHTTPAAPIDLNAKAGDGIAEIAFTAGDDGGAPISNYEYQLGDGPWTRFDPAATVSPVSIGGLTNGTQYNVRLRAVNAAGSGAASTPLAVTPSAPPGPSGKKPQEPLSPNEQPPPTIKIQGTTVVTPRDARTNAGQPIRTQVRGWLGRTSSQGETRYFRVIRGPEGKVSIRTYGYRGLTFLVRQYAPPTTTYRAYRDRVLYKNGRRR